MNGAIISLCLETEGCFQARKYQKGPENVTKYGPNTEGPNVIYIPQPVDYREVICLYRGAG